MAIGNIPTLMDTDFGALRAQQTSSRNSQFVLDFTNKIREKGLSISPQLYVNEDGKSVGFQGSGKMLSDDELWNAYVKNAQTRRVQADLNTFEQTIKPIYKKYAMENFDKQLANLQMQGVKKEKIHDLYRNNPEFKVMLQKAIVNAPDEASMANLLELKPDINSGIWNTISGMGPMGIAAAGYGGYHGYKALNRALFDSAKPEGFMGKIGKGLKGPMGLVAGSLAIDPLAQMLGATESEREGIQTGVGAAFTAGYLGQYGGNVMKKNYLDRLTSTKTKSKLVERAKALGLSDDDLKEKKEIKRKGKKAVKGKKATPKSTYTRTQTKTAADIKKLIESKVKGQSASKTGKAIKGLKLPSTKLNFAAKGRMGAILSLLYSVPGLRNMLGGGDSALQDATQTPSKKWVNPYQ